VQFADHVRAISSTQLDLVGVVDFPEHLAHRLRGFDEIITWYGTNRPDFRQAMSHVHQRCTFLNALPDSQPAVDFYSRQVGAPPGLIPRIQVKAAELRQTIVIHPFSGSPQKNWPLENYLALRLPTERADNRFESLLDLASWMSGANLYIGNDSGISHLAAAIGLPSVVLFGPTNPNVWAPRGKNVRILHHQPLYELPVETVLQAATLAAGETRDALRNFA